jgi:hypothetical protein
MTLPNAGIWRSVSRANKRRAFSRSKYFGEVKVRFGANVTATIAALIVQVSAPAHAGLINAGSTVDILFGSQTSQTFPSQVFSTGAPGPFSLASPIIPPTPPLHTTEPFNLTAKAGFWFTDTQATIYNNSTPPAPFGGDFSTFDFTFTNEDITGVSIDASSSADFLPATVTLLGQDEFKVVVGDGVDPAFLSNLVIDVTTAGTVTPGVPEPSTWALILLGFAGLGYAGYRGKGTAGKAQRV